MKGIIITVLNSVLFYFLLGITFPERTIFHAVLIEGLCAILVFFFVYSQPLKEKPNNGRME